MPEFAYRALSTTGELVVGRIEASDRTELYRSIERMGQIPIDASDTTVSETSRFSSKNIFGTRGLRGEEITSFTRDIALLLRAGLTLDEALALTAADTESAALGRLARSLRTAVAGGESLSTALSQHPKVFARSYVALVRVAETTGRLGAALESIAEDRQRSEMAAEKIRSAVRYPLFLLFVALSVLTFFLLVIIPQFEPVFRDLGARAPGSSSFLFELSSFIRSQRELVAAGLVAVIVAVVFLLRRSAVRASLWRIAARMPGLRPIVTAWRTSRFCAAFSILIRNGVDIASALRLLADLFSDAEMRDGITRAGDRVREGRKFSEAVREIAALPPLALRMMRVGEEAGEVATVAERVAGLYESRLNTGLDRLVAIIGPAAIILIALFIGSMIVSIMLTVLSINDLVS